jgi:hypothetical protein
LQGIATKGQSGIDRAALFASDDAPSGRALYLVVLPLIVVLMLAAVKFDDVVHPPLWVHALVWPPVVAVVIIGALRLVRRGHAAPDGPVLADDAPDGLASPPPCGRSPSPARGGYE